MFNPQIHTARRSSRFTFGVSRSNMKKTFVDEMHRRSSQGPAPNSYKDFKPFGEIGIQPLVRGRMRRYGDRDENYSDYFYN